MAAGEVQAAQLLDMVNGGDGDVLRVLGGLNRLAPSELLLLRTPWASGGWFIRNAIWSLFAEGGAQSRIGAAWGVAATFYKLQGKNVGLDELQEASVLTKEEVEQVRVRLGRPASDGQVGDAAPERLRAEHEVARRLFSTLIGLEQGLLPLSRDEEIRRAVDELADKRSSPRKRR